MLVLNRRIGERIVIGDNIEVVVLEVHSNRVKLGFSSQTEIPIHREELHRRITQAVQAPQPSPGPAVLGPLGCA